jgi:RNA recognition motif-containing protein
LFVGGIPLQLREHEINELFSKFGKVKHVIVLKTKYGTSKVLLNSCRSPPFHRTVLCR